MTFWGKSLEFKPKGWVKIHLKKHNETYIFNRATLNVENILIGSMYVEHHGKMKFTNQTNGYKGELNLKKRNWLGMGAYEAKGFVKNRDGSVVYTMKGKWNTDLMAVHK